MSPGSLGGEDGFEFLRGISDAIDAAVHGAVLRDPAVLSYRGVSLARAAQCELFVALSNDEDLYRSFVLKRAGQSGGAYSSDSMLGRMVAAELLGPTASVARTSARSPLAWARQLRSYAGRGGSDQAGTADRPDADGAVVFVLDHDKFLRFLAPVISTLGERRAAFVSTTEQLDADLAERALTHASLSGADEARPPAGRVMGRLLRDRTHTAATFDRLVGALIDLDASCVVVAEGNSPYDELAGRAAELLGLPSLCLQHGWSPVIHTGFRNMTFSTMSVWGDGFAELLAPWNPRQKFDVVGSPLFASRGASRSLARAGRPTVTFFKQPTSPLISGSDLVGLSGLIERTARDHPDVNVVVREHPVGPTGPEFSWRHPPPNVSFVPPTEVSLQEVLEMADLVVSIYSTTLLEAAAFGVPSVALNTTSLPSYNPDLEELGIGVEVQTVDAALSVIDRMLGDDGYRKSFSPACGRFRDRFFEDGTPDGPDRIAALIDDFAAARRV